MRYSVIYKIPVLLALALAACTPGNKADTSVAVTGVSVSPSSAELKVGQTLQLTANVLPDNASNKSVSSHPMQPLLPWTSEENYRP